jgi:hypothetical protein
VSGVTITALVVVAVVVGAIAFVVLRHGGTPAATTSAGTRPSTSATGSGQTAEQQAATTVSALLAQSVSDRAAVINAVTDVRDCGPSLRKDARTLTTSARSRQRLLSQLESMSGRSALPAALLADLTSAWQASIQADTDLAHWATDMSKGRCTVHKSSRDANLRASYVPDGQATVGKEAFAAQWNPIARRYDLTTYQSDQL